MRRWGSTILPALLALCLASAPAPPRADTPNRLLPREEVQPKGWLGVLLGRAQPSDAGEGPRLGGVEVIGIVRDSPAARAGLRAQDRVVALDGSPVTSSRELIAAVARYEPGRWISLTIERDGREREITARLVPRPADTEDLDIRLGWIGVSAIDLPPELRVHFGAPEDAGVMISGVEPGSPAESAGFDLGDVLYEVNGEPVGSTGVLRLLISRGGVGNRLELGVLRSGAEMVLEALVVEAPEPTRD